MSQLHDSQQITQIILNGANQLFQIPKGALLRTDRTGSSSCGKCLLLRTSEHRKSRRRVSRVSELLMAQGPSVFFLPVGFFFFFLAINFYCSYFLWSVSIFVCLFLTALQPCPSPNGKTGRRPSGCQEYFLPQSAQVTLCKPHMKFFASSPPLQCKRHCRPLKSCVLPASGKVTAGCEKKHPVGLCMLEPLGL